MSRAKNVHIGHQAMAMMDQLGVMPVPRNFALFYNFVLASSRDLRKAVEELPQNPSQGDLDRIIDEHMPEAFGSETLKRQQDEVIRSLEKAISRLNVEQSGMQSFTGAVNQMATSISKEVGTGNMSPDKLLVVANALIDASRRKMSGTANVINAVGGSKDELSQVRTELEHARLMAYTDDLTKIPNRRAFDEHLGQLYSFDRERNFGLLILDIDHFKRINDEFGHYNGDRVLGVVANQLKAGLRKDGFLARIGGEEFGVIVRTGKPEELQVVAERLRATIEALDMKNRTTGDAGLKLTVSVGGCMAQASESQIALYEQADMALYRSKNGGRNMVTMFDGPSPESTARYQLYGSKGG